MKGFYKCKNPSKYAGDKNSIIYRSSYEIKAFMILDNDPSVISWGSEEFSIPYISPKDFKFHRYYPDIIVKRQTSSGVMTTIYEIKPGVQVIPPKASSNKKRFISETLTYAVNLAKWEAAKKFAEDRGWKFELLTEKELNIPVRSTPSKN